MDVPEEHLESRRQLGFPPPSHFAHFKKTCPCIDTGLQDRVAVLVRILAARTNAPMFTYRCVRCGYQLTDFLGYRLVGEAKWIGLESWCPGASSPAALAVRFSEIPGVLLPASVLAPAPGELPRNAIVEATEKEYHYFVDEAGDPNLTGRQRRVIIGEPGCSRTFMIGAAYVKDKVSLDAAVRELHCKVMTDASLSHIESLKPSRKRTALCFHASKDHPAVRRIVFEELGRLPVRVLAVVRRKDAILRQAAAWSEDGQIRFSWQREFDSMIARLFKDRLHLAQRSNIVVANRGASDRTEHLVVAVGQAKRKFEIKWGVVNPHEVKLQTGSPDEHPGLQAVDYMLWALQRVFERGDFASFERIQSSFRLVVDVDDRTSQRKTGTYFSTAYPLTPQSLKPFGG